MHNSVKVTIVTAFYNRLASVQRTLESLARQSYLDYEVIVFDDCSTDGTSVAIDEFVSSENAEKFRIIRPERNIGMTAGFIAAIGSARGKYIAIQGAGDVSLPRRLEAQVKFLDNNPDVCLVGCHYRNIVEDISRFRVRTPDAADMSIAQLIENNVFSHGEVMFRKEAYVACGGYRIAFRYSQDIDLWLRMRRLGNFATVPEILYDRYVQKDGVTYNVNKFPIQARYGLLARRIALMNPEEAESILDGLSDEKLLKLIPLDDPELQQRFAKSLLTMAIWGNPYGARSAAATLIKSPTRRFVLRMLSLALDGPMKPIVQFAVDRASGMRSL